MHGMLTHVYRALFRITRTPPTSCLLQIQLHINGTDKIARVQTYLDGGCKLLKSIFAGGAQLMLAAVAGAWKVARTLRPKGILRDVPRGLAS
jgi:hypothetical protein